MSGVLCGSPAGPYPLKRLCTILLFLVLGAVVNVGVAWGIAICLDIEKAMEDIID